VSLTSDRRQITAILESNLSARSIESLVVANDSSFQFALAVTITYQRLFAVRSRIRIDSHVIPRHLLTDETSRWYPQSVLETILAQGRAEPRFCVETFASSLINTSYS